MNNNNEDKILIRHWFYTVFGYTLFILINLIQFIFFMPIFFIISLIFDKDKKLFPYLTKFFSYMFFTLYFVEKIDFQRGNLKAPKKGEKRIYVLNHASQYDVILMYILPGPIKFIFKEKWAKLPIVGWMAAIAGNLILKDNMNAGESLILFRKAAEELEKGIPFVIYPEGTRSRDGKIGEFFHGTFKLALEAKADLVPVVFDSWNCIRPGALWIRDTRPSIRILDTIKYEDFEHLNYVKLSHYVRMKMIEGLISLRDERRLKQKNYYRKIPKFEEIDNMMKEELKKLKEYLDKKNIKLKSELKQEQQISSN